MELRCIVVRIENELVKEARLEFHPSAVLFTGTGKLQMKFQKLSRCQVCYFLTMFDIATFWLNLPYQFPNTCL